MDDAQPVVRSRASRLHAGGASLRVAAFDVDGTLTDRDCVVPFLRRVAGASAPTLRLLGTPSRLVGALRRRDRDALKAMASAAALTGRPESEVRATAEQFARHVEGSWIRPEMRDALESHRRAGDLTVLVSASFEVYLQPLGSLLGVDGVLGTRLEVDGSGRLTGRLDGPNCRGPEKVIRLHEWLGERIGGREDAVVTAYGDSPGDRELLADAEIAHWIAPAGRCR